MTAVDAGTTRIRQTTRLQHDPAAGPRRVLWVVKGLGRGGAERLTVNSARRFNPHQWSIDVAYVLPHKNAFVEDLRAAGVGVHCVGDAGTRAGWVRRLVSLVRAGSYDLVHTHSPAPAAVIRAMPARSRPPVVHTEHNLWTRYRPLTRTVNAITFRRNADALAVSDGVAASMIPVFTGSRTKVLHHGIDVARAVHGADGRHRARRALGLHDDWPVVGCVANFTPKKDHHSLLHAVRDVARQHNDLRLVLVGSGPLDAELRGRVATLGLDGRVIFAGSRDDVLDLLPAFDVFALSSRYEGLPIALLEAMASAVPPVATAVGGVAEVITDGVDGLLVPARQRDELAAAIDRVLLDDDLRRDLGAAARARAADFDIGRAVDAMAAWYEEILR